MATDCRKILIDLQTRFGESHGAAKLLDELVELIDAEPELQLAVYKAGYLWDAGLPQPDVRDDLIRATLPGKAEAVYEVYGVQGHMLACRSECEGHIWTGLIRRDCIVPDDRDKFDRIVSRVSAS